MVIIGMLAGGLVVVVAAVVWVVRWYAGAVRYIDGIRGPK